MLLLYCATRRRTGSSTRWGKQRSMRHGLLSERGSRNGREHALRKTSTVSRLCVLGGSCLLENVDSSSANFYELFSSSLVSVPDFMINH